MKKVVFALLASLAALQSVAQESQTEYNFLRLPASAHASALGGDNISLMEDDEALIFNNPALLHNVSSKTIALGYMNYMSGVNMGTAAFNYHKDKASYAASIQYVDYGTMKETDATGLETGDFSAKDISIAGYVSYALGRNVTGGLSGKFITSYIGSYNSIAVVFDLGMTYYNPESEFSAGLAVKNLGGQLQAYDEEYEKMPTDVQIGLTKRFAHMPFRISATLVDLTHWDYSFVDHAVIGVDLLLSKSIWVGGGYNFRRAKEMKISDGEDSESSHGAGFSLGGGINLERFKLNIGWGKYHVNSSSLLFNLAYTLK